MGRWQKGAAHEVDFWLLNNVLVSYKEKVFICYVCNRKKFVLKTSKTRIIQGLIMDYCHINGLELKKTSSFKWAYSCLGKF